MKNNRGWTRRKVLKGSAAASGALTLLGPGLSAAWAQGSDTIRVGVVGCGNRGLAAAQQCVKAAPGVQVVALADAFAPALAEPKKAFGVADNHCFVGLDACSKLLALADVNLVILATPPAFRPAEFAEAVAKGKHVFMEAPAAICPTGVAKVVEAAKQAAEKKLAVVAGTQRRHHAATVETMKRIHDGAIGPIIAAQCYSNTGAGPARKRQAGESEVQWQLRNWSFIRRLSGDVVVSQFIHQIDVLNWAFNALPEIVQGLGGKQAQTAEEYGNVYDHFGIEFAYPGDVLTLCTCRRIDGTDDRVGEHVVGTKGSSNCCGVIEGEKAWRYQGPDADPFAQQMADLIAGIRSGNPLNEGQQIADSTFTAVMARESAYSRMRFKRSWFASKCTLDLLPPADLKLAGALPLDPVAVPGKYELVGLAAEGAGRKTVVGDSKGDEKPKGKGKKGK